MKHAEKVKSSAHDRRQPSFKVDKKKENDAAIDVDRYGPTYRQLHRSVNVLFLRYVLVKDIKLVRNYLDIIKVISC